MEEPCAIVEQVAGLERERETNGHLQKILSNFKFPRMLGIDAQGSVSVTNVDCDQYYPSPTLLNHILTHRCDQGGKTHSSQHSPTIAREPAWYQDTLARTVRQAMRTHWATAIPPPPEQAQAMQADKQDSQEPSIFIFIHMRRRG